MNTTIDTSQDVIDSREIIDRIEELESEQESYKEDADSIRGEIFDLKETIEDAEDDETIEKLAAELTELEEQLAAAEEALEAWEDDEGAELDTLREIAAEGKRYSDAWNVGVQLIRYSYFEEDTREFAESCGLDEFCEWPYRHIDWKEAADERMENFAEIDVDGCPYYIECI